jgi:TolA-binding protein
MIKNVLLLVVLVGFLPACLQTRSQLRDSPQGASKIESKPIVFSQNGKITGNSNNVTSAPVAAPQISKEAQTDSRFEDVNKDFRQLYGKVETVENQMNQLKENKALEEKIAQLESKIALLETTVVDLNTKSKKEPVAPAKSTSTKADKNELAAADQFYSDKKWEDAILAYEDFRKQNPKGKSYAEATYKIGVCFQNLGMKDDAKAFFKEVVDKYPSAKEAGLAKSKLKKI